MKTSKRIATFLIVFVLGIIVCPRAKAIVNHGDSIQIQEDPHKKQKFSGFIIDPFPADRLLYTRQTLITNEISTQFVPTVYDNKHDTGFTEVENSYSKNYCDPKSNSSSIVMNNKECLKKKAKSIK